MNRKRHGNPAAAGLALCTAMLALLAALTEGGGISTAQNVPASETPVIAFQEVFPDADLSRDQQTAATPETNEASTPCRVLRYTAASMNPEERRELAKVIYLEAANQCAEGQQAVAEVVLNRVIAMEFPDTVHDVLHEGEDTPRPQFSSIGLLALAEPTAAQYDAIDAALYGPSILPEDVVFFSRDGENDRVWGTIQDHVFCYKYIWE